MKFAHFSHVWAKPGMTPHQRYEELWRELDLCDELGFDFSFCVEHHFRPDESWISSPSLYAVGAGARTKRMRIGPMGYIVPLLSSAAARRGNRHRRPDARRPHGMRAGARHQPRLFPPLRPRLRPPQIADASSSSITCAPPMARRSRFRSRAKTSRPTSARAGGAAGAEAASAALDDEPRSADARILRPGTASIPAIS